MTSRHPLTQFGPVDTVIAPLRERYGDRVSVVQAVREQHARGEGLATSLAPDVVVWPLDKHEVCAILALCNERRVPVIAFGAGSSLEGHVSAPFGGVCIDMSRMDAISAINAEDTDCVVQPDHPRGAQRPPERNRSVLPGRPGRQRHHRRHGLDPRFRHHHAALRLDGA